jgi:hypothetical protein
MNAVGFGGVEIIAVIVNREKGEARWDCCEQSEQSFTKG